MAYNTKYRFRLESCNDAVYEVRILEDGYSGSVIDRPLGKSPVIRMQNGDPVRATSCDLVLECHTDGEFVDLYTTDPFQYKVEVHAKTGNAYTILWRGYVATEIYSEPDIAPPYDVHITATDGLGILKEYTFASAGLKTVRAHICDLLKIAGDATPMYLNATQLCAYGDTPAHFQDDVNIDLDYMAGKSCYDVLCLLMTSLRSIITYRGSYWLIVREVDAQINSTGTLTAIQCVGSDPTLPAGSTTQKMGKSVGQMGVADMWPVGYLTRRVVPDKNAVKVRMEWKPKSGADPLEDWTGSDDATLNTARWTLGNLGGTGTITSHILFFGFTRDLRVTIKTSQIWTASSLYGTPYVKVLATFFDGTNTYYYRPDSGWGTTSPAQGDEYEVKSTNYYNDVAAAETIEVDIPAQGSSNSGQFTLSVVGHQVEVYQVDAMLNLIKGYEDTIYIDNGARGSASDIDITGGRETSTDLIPRGFVRGVFGSVSNSSVITAFSDGSETNKDFMSITALAYAKEVAAPRIEITGTLNHVYDSQLGMPPMFIKSHGVWAMMSQFDWDMKNEDVNFTAVTLPTASLTVSSEVVNSMANEGSGSSSGGSSGGGGGGGTYVLPIASASVLGGVKVGSGLSIDSTTGVLSSSGGGSTVSVQSLAATSASVSRIAKVTIDGTDTYIYNDAAWGSAGSTANTFGLTINGTTKTVCLDGYSSGGGSYTLPIASSSVLGGIKVGSGLSIDGSGVLSATGGGGGGSGTVTSVGMTVPTGLSVSGSPVTTSGTLAVSLASGYVIPQQSTLDGYVTKGTTQTITGEKTFTTNPINVGSTSGISVNGSSYIDIGDARLVYDSTNKALHITVKSGSETIGLYADGFVVAGGSVASGDQIKFVSLTGAQTVGGVKTFSDGIVVNSVTINGGTKLTVDKDAQFKYSSNPSKYATISNIIERLEEIESILGIS